MTIIPTFQNLSSSFVQDIELNGELFNLLISWNARQEAWYFDIRDSDKNNIIAGIRLVPSYLLLFQFQYNQNLPKGDFYLLDLEQNPKTSDLTFNNLNERYVFYFLTDEELGRE